MRTFNGEKIPVAHAHCERKNKTARCTCALWEKFTFCTGSWPSQIVDTMHGYEKCATRAEGRFRLVWNLQHEPSSRIRLFSVKPRLRSRLNYGSCCKLHTLIWNRPHYALVTQYSIVKSARKRYGNSNSHAFYRDIKFLKFDVSGKLPLWGSQNQVTCFLKEGTFSNQWGSNKEISMYILFKIVIVMRA